MSKLVIYVDMDGVLCNFELGKIQTWADNPEIKYPQSQYGFYTNLKPIEGGISSVRRLHESDYAEVYILTAPSIYNPLSYTEKRIWVENHLGFDMVDRLIISSDKSLLKGDVLIDDNDSGKGQESFEGHLIHFGSSKFPDWYSVNRLLTVMTCPLEIG